MGWYNTIFIVQQICDKNDEYYTPRYAVIPILKYIKPKSTIWCPFDQEQSQYVSCFRENGHTVIASHTDDGEDFFVIREPKCDYIISNPPYSRKNDILERLFDIGIPFAILLGATGLFDSQIRYDMFKNNKFEIMYLYPRVDFFRTKNETRPSGRSPYQSVYVCQNILPQQIMFEKIDLKDY